MRLILALPFTLIAAPAFAHPGHFAELAGHSHWIALGALVAAGALTAWALGGKGKKADDAEAVDDETEAEEDEDATRLPS